MPAGHTRRRTRSALGPAGFVLPGLLLALLGAPSTAAAQDPQDTAGHPSYTRAYVALGAGAALTGLSFVLAEKADRAYDRYLAETDPVRLEDAYQDAKTLDKLSAASLIAGQAGLVLGLYWRFLHKPNSTADMKTPAWGVTPVLQDGGAGLVVDVRF